MRPPELPRLSAVEMITPSLYNAALACPARALWAAFGPRRFYPASPSAVLGNACHGVLEDCVNGLLPVEDRERQQAASRLFEAKAEQGLARAHPLLRWRYPDVRRMPYYFTFQARAGAAALRIPARRSRGAEGGQPDRRAEWRLTSRDGSVGGRIDLVDERDRAVIDYKTGGDPPSNVAFRPEEERQLRLYAYLCLENGVTIERGVIERGGGRRDEMPIAGDESCAEGSAAKALLAGLNARISHGETIHELAAPSPEGCRGCEGRVLCEPFWNALDAKQEAAETMCLEGEVLSCVALPGMREPAFTLHLRVLRGDRPGMDVTTDAIPSALSIADGDTLPQKGDVVRVLDAKASQGSHSTVRPCLAGRLTTVWRMPPGR